MERFFEIRFAPGLRKFRFCVLLGGLGFTVLCLVLVASSIKIASEPPVFFVPGSHNLGDVFDVQAEFSNMTDWKAAMEKQALKLCVGCAWNEQEGRSKGCRFVGAECDATPCFYSEKPCNNGRGSATRRALYRGLHAGAQGQPSTLADDVTTLETEIKQLDEQSCPVNCVISNWSEKERDGGSDWTSHVSKRGGRSPTLFPEMQCGRFPSRAPPALSKEEGTT